MEHCDFIPIYAITAETISKKLSKSNSPKNPACKNFGHLNQSNFQHVLLRNKCNDLLTVAIDSVPNTASIATVVEPSMFDNQVLFSKFYMPVDEYRAHFCLFFYHELQN